MNEKQKTNRKGISLWRDAWRRLLKNRAAIISAGIIVVLIVFTVLAPKISKWTGRSYRTQHLEDQFQPPSWTYPMGTDLMGRDLMMRLLYGGAISLLVGVVGATVSLVVGLTYGAIAGYVGGKLDNAMMRLVDILYGLPYMFIVILLIAILGKTIQNPSGRYVGRLIKYIHSVFGSESGSAVAYILLLFIALGLVEWLTMARIVRGQVISLREREYVGAAQALGAGRFRIIFRHIVPNLLGTVIVYLTLTVPRVMLQESFLSFLGLGVQAPMCSWGSLAADGAQVINPIKIYWWLIVFPGGALTVTLFALNFLGDGLRDALDPLLKR